MYFRFEIGVWSSIIFCGEIESNTATKTMSIHICSHTIMCPQKFGFENTFAEKIELTNEKLECDENSLVKNSTAMCKHTSFEMKIGKINQCCLDYRWLKMRFQFVYWNYIKRIEVYFSPMQWSQFV